MSRELTKEKDKKAELLKASEAILDRATTEGRPLSAGEQKTLDGNGGAIEKCNTEIDRLTKLDDYRRHGMPLAVTGFENDYPGKIINSIFDPAPLPDWCKGERPQVKGRIGATYAQLFAGRGGPCSDMPSSEFFGALSSGTFHPALNALNEASGSAGGFIVPEQISQTYFGAAYENSIVWPRATVYPMQSETLKVVGLDASTAAAGTLFGGMSSEWLGEEGTGTPANPKFRKCLLHSHKCAIFSTASNELAEDGLNLESQIVTAMQTGTAWALDYSFISGTGVGQPLGILHDPALITVTKEDGQDADSIVYENVIKCLSRLHTSCFAKSIWLANPTTIPQILSLTAPAGLGATPVPVLRETDGGWSLLTRPLFFSEKVPSLGDAGDLVLVDLSQYAIGLRRELTIERSQHVRFMSDESVWRGIVRLDGQGLWNNAYTPLTGDTQSWVVALGARA
jgi:HK97 family phage major capsid protein